MDTAKEMCIRDRPSGEVMRRKLWLSKMLRMETAVFLWLGTSMPTAGLPGMGASKMCIRDRR